MSKKCATEGCGDPNCPVCRYVGRDPVEVSRELRVKWQRAHGIRPWDDRRAPEPRTPQPRTRKG